jgi:hypothetical protein
MLVALAALVATATGLTVWLVGSGGGSTRATQPTDDPVLFLRGIVRGIARNEYDRIWPSLHRRSSESRPDASTSAARRATRSAVDSTGSKS